MSAELDRLKGLYPPDKDKVYPVVLQKGQLLDTSRYEEIRRVVKKNGTILVYCYMREQGDSFIGRSSEKFE